MKYQIATLAAGLLMANAVSAATAVNLQNQPVSYLQHYLAVQKTFSANAPQPQLKTLRTDVDFNRTGHTRIQQMVGGVPVWHATAVVHNPQAGKNRDLSAAINAHSTMNGVIYEGLEKDLSGTPAFALTDNQAAKAMQQAKLAYSKKTGVAPKSYSKESIKKIIYIDDKTQRAHYAYLVSFYYDDGLTGAHKPATIIDASSLQVYRSWDQVMNVDPLETKEAKAAMEKLNKLRFKKGDDDDGDDEPEIIDITAGGIGGNGKIGDTIYDGSPNNKPAGNMKAVNFNIEALPGQTLQLTLCGLINEDTVVVDVPYAFISYGLCVKYPNAHNGIAWLSLDNNQTRWKSDEVNSGFSPSLDAFYAANVIKQFYKEWYGVPPLVDGEGDNAEPMPMVMMVHYGRNFDNAFWDGEVMTFGDGGKLFYPLTSVGVGMHEISHGFTSQHAGIDSSLAQMGALHEAFSDMAAVSMHYYLTNNSLFEIGREIRKDEQALRYLDNPTKDGHSIDNMKDFDVDTEAHSGAGVFNKAFYLIATTNGWDIHKAFNIMVKANMHYWTSSMTTLTEAACGVVSATKDYGYDVSDVRVAFAKVGIDTDQCNAH